MMKIAVFSTKPYDREFLEAANASRHEFRFFEPRLSSETASLAAGFDAVCVFVNDQANAEVVASLASFGVRLIALRCAGYNNVDLVAAQKHGITVVRVPSYSPYAVVAGIELGLDIASQLAFQNLIKRWVAPTKRMNREETLAFLRRACSTYFHPVGTCAMGTDNDAVVDAELRVGGAEHPRIPDAAVMAT